MGCCSQEHHGNGGLHIWLLLALWAVAAKSFHYHVHVLCANQCFLKCVFIQSRKKVSRPIGRRFNFIPSFFFDSNAFGIHRFDIVLCMYNCLAEVRQCKTNHRYKVRSKQRQQTQRNKRTIITQAHTRRLRHHELDVDLGFEMACRKVGVEMDIN